MRGPWVHGENARERAAKCARHDAIVKERGIRRLNRKKRGKWAGGFHSSAKLAERQLGNLESGCPAARIAYPPSSDLFVRMATSETNTASVPEDFTGRPRRVATQPTGFRRMFAAFRHRNYRLFFMGQLVSLIGTWMNNTAEGWLVYQLTGSKAMLGIVAAASSGPMLFFSTFGGAVADRFPKRSILVVMQVLNMVLSFLLAYLVWAGSVRPWQIIVLALLGGVVMAFDMPARQSFVIEMTSREDLTNAISLNSSMVNGARILGPSLAGILMAKVSIAFCFFADGVSFIAVIAGLLLMRLAPHVRAAHEGSALEHALGGFRYAWSNTRVLTILTLFAVVGIFGWSYSVLMPAFARDILGLGEEAYGALLAASGVGALIGALSIAGAGHWFTPRQLVLGGVWIFSAMIIPFSFSRNLYLAMAFLAGAGFGMMLFFSTSNSALQKSVPDEMRGRIMGIWALVFGGMMPFGSLEAGTVAHFIGVPATIVLGAIICAMAAGVTLVIVRRRDSAS